MDEMVLEVQVWLNKTYNVGIVAQLSRQKSKIFIMN